jgi:hypothetical protein
MPDVQESGDVQFTLLGKSQPTATEYSYGPYLGYPEHPTATRAQGRQLRLQVDGLKRQWEVGNTSRSDVQPVAPSGVLQR